MLEWSRDPRCAVRYGTLAHRISQSWDAEQAITRAVERRERHQLRPARMLTAFGETKSVNEWEADERSVVASNVFLRRIQHGWTPETALTAPVTSSRGKRGGAVILYEAFGETKTLREWAQDERCKVSEMTLRKNLQAGMSAEQAFMYRRKPGRHFVAAPEDLGGKISEESQVLALLNEGAELWVYASSGVSRISLIHDEMRLNLSEELFSVLLGKKLIAKSFETDTVKNFELTELGRSAKGQGGA